MLSRFNEMPIAKQITLILLLLNTLIFSGIIIFISVISNQSAIISTQKKFMEETNLIEQQFEQFNTLLEKEISNYALMFGRLFPGEFSLLKDQVRKTGEYSAQVITLDGELLNNDFSKIDQFTNLSGAIATLFVKSGDDFLRITTSLKKSDGTRAMGTFLGTTHPGYKNFIKGQPYVGRANLFGRQYMTRYDPIKDSTGEVIGLLFVGQEFTKKLAELEEIMANIRIGEQGYIFAINAAPGDKFSQAMIHPTLKGKILATQEDSDGIFNITDVFSSETGSFIYQRQEGGQKTNKIIAYQSFPQWNWVVGTIGYLDENTRAALAQRNQLLLMTLAAVTLLLAITFFTISKKLSPLKQVRDQLLKIGEGDLSKNQARVNVKPTTNEIQQVLQQLETTRTEFALLIGGILRQIEQLTDTSQALNQISTENSQVVVKQNEEADQIAIAITEMSASIREVAGNANNTSEQTEQSNDAVSNSTKLMLSSQQAIEIAASELEKAINIIQQLADKSQNVGSVLEVIGSIAEQTNLLALNAAIEAARAGEQGRGFAVVADEVRNLAKGTQESTAEIKAIIESLQISSQQAVDSVSSVGRKTSESVDYATQVMSALKSIATSSQEINDMTTQIATASEQQNAVSADISLSSLKLNESAKLSSKLAQQTSESAADLHQMAYDLTQHVNKFRL